MGMTDKTQGQTLGGMRIAHLTTVHARTDTRITGKMCRSLAAAGHSTTLYVADGLGDSWIDGVRVIDIGKPVNRLWRATLSSAAMWLRARRDEHDILHFHDPELIAGALACRLIGQRIIYDIHEYYRPHLRRTRSLPRWLASLIAKAYGIAERAAAQWLDACVVVSAHMLAVLPLKRAIVVANAVRPEEFSPGPLPHRRRPASVCYVGVLSEERCIGTLVEALPPSDAWLELAGRWYPQDYQHQVEVRPGWERVRRWGEIGRREVQDLMACSRAGMLILDLHGDEQYASSNKLFEYMAAGLPVIASDLPFTREVIERHGCGLLVSAVADGDQIARAIRWLIDNPEEAEQMGQAGRQAVEQIYGWEHEMATLIRLYHDLYEAKPKQALAPKAMAR
jgi:glycosyltransferase involved in cell wall biosynthesis